MKDENAHRAVAGTFDPVAEDSYWRSHYSSRPYVEQNTPYSEYRPAYRYGWLACSRFFGRPFDHVEKQLEHGWDGERGLSMLDWPHAKSAVRDAWNHVERVIRPPRIARDSG